MNDPFRGGTHLPDVTLVHPVFLGRRLRFFAACRAHYSDIGGMSPGSMPLSTDVWQEGFLIPPMKLDASVRRLLLANVRQPLEVEGDLDAQIGACVTGRRRLEALAARYGAGELFAARANCRPRTALHGGGDPTDSGQDPPVRTGWIRGTPQGRDPEAGARRHGRFRGFAAGSDNTNAKIFASRVGGALLLPRSGGVPLNAGAAAPIRIERRGSIVNARPRPRWRQETSSVAADRRRPLQRARKGPPGPDPHGQPGAMNNVVRRSRFAYYETLAGAGGPGPVRTARTASAGARANTLNTPIDALERSHPVRMVRYAFPRGSGGAGRHRGGNGLVREYEFLRPAQVSILGERRTRGPWGLAGGGEGKPGIDRLNGKKLPGRAEFKVGPGDRLSIETPGGGGYGRR